MLGRTPQTYETKSDRPFHFGGFSRSRLERMSESMRRHIESGWAPGLVTLVHHRGREHVDTIGTMAFGGERPMRRDTIFRLASMTKPITAVAAMILIEECKLRLDDPVPATMCPRRNLSAWRPATARIFQKRNWLSWMRPRVVKSHARPRLNPGAAVWCRPSTICSPLARCC